MMIPAGWDYLGRDEAMGGGWWVDAAGSIVGWSREEDSEILAAPPTWDYLGAGTAPGGGWWVDANGQKVGWSRQEDTEIIAVRGSAATTHQMRGAVDVLLAEAYDAPPDEFVQEVVLGIGQVLIVPEPPEPPILTFSSSTWTLIQGTYGTVDDRGRTALAVGEGDPSPGSWTKFTAPTAITASSDWTIVLLATGEINDDYGAIIVEETGGGGLELEVSEAVGIDEGDIISGTVTAPNANAFSPALTSYRIVHEAGVTSIYIDSVLWGTGAGVGASGASTITVTLPPGVAIFELLIYDYALEP